MRSPTAKLRIPVISAAVLLALAFPPLSVWPLAFVSIALFMAALEGEESAAGRAVSGVVFGGVHSVAMGYWIFYALMEHYGKSFPTSLLFFLVSVSLPLGLLYSCFAVLYGMLHTKRLWFYALTAPSLWIIADYIREILPFLVPWGMVGYALLPMAHFVQVADIVGIYGVSFLVVMIGCLLVVVWTCLHQCVVQHRQGRFVDRDMRSRAGAGIVLLSFIIACTMGYGKVRLQTVWDEMQAARTASRKIPVTIAQGNFSLKDRWSGTGFLGRLHTYLALSHAGKTGEGRIIVWPETVLNSSTKANAAVFGEIAADIGPSALLVSGGLRKGKDGAVFNSAYFISGNGWVRWYDKHILLPYSESAPLWNFLGQYYRAPSQFATGQSPSTVETAFGRIGASICFEILYPNYIRRSVTEGAAVLINISNDTWFGDSGMPGLHLDAARFRAIENRRFLLRASNSGISAVVSPTGELLEASGLFTRSRIDGNVTALHQTTVYSRYGDGILLLAAVLLLMSLGRLLRAG